MVTFNEKSFTIEIETGINPAENWLILVQSLCHMIRNTTADNIDNDFYACIDFLAELMPDEKTAQKMTK